MQILERWAWRLTWLLPVWGAVTIPATLSQQPDAKTDFAAYADYITTTWFLLGHLVGSIAGTVLGILGIVGLTVILARTRVARSALACGDGRDRRLWASAPRVRGRGVCATGHRRCGARRS